MLALAITDDRVALIEIEEAMITVIAIFDNREQAEAYIKEIGAK